MSDPVVVPADDRLLSLEEWLEVPSAVLGIPAKVAVGGAKLDAVIAALTVPADRVDDRYLYPDMPAKAAALTTRLLRAKVTRVGNREVALATTARYLEINGLQLAIPAELQPDVDELADEVARGQASETQLASLLAPFISPSGADLPEQGSDTLLVHIGISELGGVNDRRKNLCTAIDRSAVQAAKELADPVDLATTCPGLAYHPPAEAWQTSRAFLIRGDRALLGPERAHCASGVIVLGDDGGGVDVGLELAMAGPRAPVLWLAPAGAEVPRLIQGYAETHGNLYIARYAHVDDLRAAVRSFITQAAARMLVLARYRRDAALASVPLQLRLRRQLMQVDETELKLLLIRTGFTIAYLIELLTEPAEYNQATLGDLRFLANELGEPFEDHVSLPATRVLSTRQEMAWLRATRQRGLNEAISLELRDRGRDLVALEHGRVSLTEAGDWETLLDSAPLPIV